MVLRCTAKILTLLGARPRDLVTIEPGDQDWYANLLWLDGRKCLLLAHAGTLFAIFVPDIRKPDLMPIGPYVVRFIHKELEAESFPLDRLGALDSRSIALAKTESRTVLGYMNEMARFCEYAVGDAGGLARCDALGAEPRAQEGTAPVPAAPGVHRSDRTGRRIPQPATA